MSEDSLYKVVAARALATGDVVYLTGCDEWSPDVNHAELIDDDDHADFRLFVAERQDRIVAAPQLAAVRLGEAGPMPLASGLPASAAA